LQSAQLNFISVVLNHLQNRMMLYRELGIMELDDCGMWIDKPLNEADWLTEEQSPLPPAVPVEWMQDAGIDPRATQEYAVEYENDSRNDSDDFPPVTGEPVPLSRTGTRESTDRQPMTRLRRFTDSRPANPTKLPESSTKLPEPSAEPSSEPAEEPAAQKTESLPQWVPSPSGRRNADSLPEKAENRKPTSAAPAVEEAHWIPRSVPAGPAFQR